MRIIYGTKGTEKGPSTQPVLLDKSPMTEEKDPRKLVPILTKVLVDDQTNPRTKIQAPQVLAKLTEKINSLCEQHGEDEVYDLFIGCIRASEVSSERVLGILQKPEIWVKYGQEQIVTLTLSCRELEKGNQDLEVKPQPVLATLLFANGPKVLDAADWQIGQMVDLSRLIESKAGLSAAVLFVTTAATTIEKNGTTDLTAWVNDGLVDLGAAEAYFGGRTERSKKLIAEMEETGRRRVVTYSEMNNRCGIYCGLITGEEILIHPSGPDQGFGPAVSPVESAEKRPAKRYDIYLPIISSDAPTRELNELDYVVSSLHECGHIAEGSFQVNLAYVNWHGLDAQIIAFDEDKGIATVRVLSDREVAWYEKDGNRTKLIAKKLKKGDKVNVSSTHSLASRCLSYPKLFLEILNYVEDARVDSENCRKYEGMRGDYERNMKMYFDLHPSITSETLNDVLEALKQQILFDKTKGRLPPKVEAIIMPLYEMARVVREPGVTSTTSLNIALEIYRRLEQLGSEQFTNKRLPHSMPHNWENSKLILTLTDSEEGATVSKDDLDKIKKKIRDGSAKVVTVEELQSGEDGKEEEIDDGANGNGGTNGKQQVIVVGAQNGETEQTQDPEKLRMALSEWNYEAGRFREDWCQARARKLPMTEALRKPPQHLVAITRRMFEAVQASDLVLRSRQTEGEEVDDEAFFEYLSERRTGGVREERFYLQRRVDARDMVIALLLDATGSAVLPVHPWNPKRRVIDVLAETAAVFHEAAMLTGDPTAVFYYRSKMRQLDILIAQDFDERLRDISAIEPSDYTRAGAAVRYAIRRLMERPEKNKRLILQWDLMPYAEDEYKTRYGIEDVKHAFIEAYQEGIVPITIFTPPSAKTWRDHFESLEAYANYITLGRYMMVKGVEDLPEGIVKLYRYFI